MTAIVVMEAMVAAVAEATGVAGMEMEAAVGVAAVEEAGVAEVVVATAVTVTTIEVAAEAEVVGVAAVTAGVVVAMTWVGGGQAGETAVVSRSSIRLTSAMRLVAEAEVTEVAAAAATET